jgi:hypothetical protein
MKTKMTTKELLDGLSGADLEQKAERIQTLVAQTGFGACGIMYSMQRLVDGEVRPFNAADFEGTVGLNPAVGKLEIAGTWEALQNENSITTSGIYLASQAYRIQAEDTPAAREQAAKAFRSIEIIYEMGVKGGQPGWMCKPYGFRPSNQTSPDQYVDACWGLYAYHAVAPADHRRKIEEMLAAFADYWRSVDYTLTYFGNTWNFGAWGGYGNAKLILVNVLAYHFTGRAVYMDEVRRFLDRANWMRGSDVSDWRTRLEEERQKTGQLSTYVNGPAQFAKHLLKPGEVLFWESAILCKFVAVAAEIIQEIQPDLLGGKLPHLLQEWWEQGSYGTGEDALPYYWFAADFLKGTWRPLPNTPPLPREQWPLGDPFMAYTSQVRWNEPLARLLVTSVIACRHAPDLAKRAEQEARHILGLVDETRLHWIVDPDGQQLPQELRYYGQCLSSEMPASFLAAYWRGRRDGLWR